MSKPEPLQNQQRHWSRHAARYEDLFIDPFAEGVSNPLWDALREVADPASKTVADLGCGTGPLLPWLSERFGQVIALDFAPGMLREARKRVEPANLHRVRFLQRSMEELEDLAGELDVAVAINSLVVPDERAIDRILRAIRRPPPGRGLMGIVPSIDAIEYHTMLVLDQALEQGSSPGDAASPHSTPSTGTTTSAFRPIPLRRPPPEVPGSPSRWNTAWPRPASVPTASPRSCTRGRTCSTGTRTWTHSRRAGTGSSGHPSERAGRDERAPSGDGSMTSERRSTPEQERSIKERERELFVAPEEKSAAKTPVKPFAVYLRETPAEPLSTAVKVILWAVGIVVVLLFVAAIWRSRRTPRRPKLAPAEPSCRHRPRGRRARHSPPVPPGRRTQGSRGLSTWPGLVFLPRRVPPPALHEGRGTDCMPSPRGGGRLGWGGLEVQ
ncbi:MAG: class I SAM-dependent methyltransferase [Isosphaeraceae bacterium]